MNYFDVDGWKQYSQALSVPQTVSPPLGRGPRQYRVKQSSEGVQILVTDFLEKKTDPETEPSSPLTHGGQEDKDEPAEKE